MNVVENFEAKAQYLPQEFVENKTEHEYWAYGVHFHVDNTKRMLMLNAWKFFDRKATVNLLLKCM